MKRALIIKFSDRYIIHSVSTLPEGGGRATTPYIIIKATSTMKEVADNLLKAMEASKINIVNTTPYKTFQKNYLNSIGLKSNKELYNGSICCSVHEKEGKIVFLPTINMGTVGGFQHNLDKKVEINSNASIEEVCNTLVEVLRRCE